MAKRTVSRKMAGSALQRGKKPGTKNTGVFSTKARRSRYLVHWSVAAYVAISLFILSGFVHSKHMRFNALLALVLLFLTKAAFLSLLSPQCEVASRTEEETRTFALGIKIAVVVFLLAAVCLTIYRVVTEA